MRTMPLDADDVLQHETQLATSLQTEVRGSFLCFMNLASTFLEDLHARLQVTTDQW